MRNGIDMQRPLYLPRFPIAWYPGLEAGVDLEGDEPVRRQGLTEVKFYWTRKDSGFLSRQKKRVGGLVRKNTRVTRAPDGPLQGPHPLSIQK